MDFTNTPTQGAGDGGSYEKPKPGKYLGVLIGFADIGTQPGGKFADQHQVLLRWELHKRKGPSLDSKGFPHTITAKFGATVRGDQSRLKKCVEAHLARKIAENEKTTSHDWLMRTAWLDLTESDDQKYINVSGFSPLDPEDDKPPVPLMKPEHWEASDSGPPPQWAQFWIGRSKDLAGRVSGSGQPGGNGARPDSKITVPPSGSQEDEDDDIPF